VQGKIPLLEGQKKNVGLDQASCGGLSLNLSVQKPESLSAPIVAQKSKMK
jgi:hypothetical protein